MTRDPGAIAIYHITDVSNLPAILKAGGLMSDIGLAGAAHQVIGYANIKSRRMTEIRVQCCSGAFVGEFVPFYFCPRSPMLYTINRGNTGRPVGCQKDIVHLQTTVAAAAGLRRDWAFSNGNAGAYHAEFFNQLESLASLDWSIIGSTDWGGDVRRHRKASEFLVKDFFEFSAFRTIGCHNSEAKRRVSEFLAGTPFAPAVEVRADWYY
jgi:hypothetical protein